MATPERTALEHVMQLAQQQMSLLERNLAQPGPPSGVLAWHCVDLLFQVLGQASATLQDDPSLPQATQSQHQAFAARVGAYQKATVQLSNHLIELSQEWRCTACQADVARTASVTGVKAGGAGLQVLLVCKACGKSSPLPPLGRKLFHALFGHLSQNAHWNPQGNGFDWDGR